MIQLKLKFALNVNLDIFLIQVSANLVNQAVKSALQELSVLNAQIISSCLRMTVSSVKETVVHVIQEI